MDGGFTLLGVLWLEAEADLHPLVARILPFSLTAANHREDQVKEVFGGAFPSCHFLCLCFLSNVEASSLKVVGF